MMRNIRLITVPLVVLICSVALAVPVSAACQKPGFNYECQRRRFIDPNETCDLFCQDINPLNPGDNAADFFQLNVFGVTLRFDSDTGVAQIIAIGFSLFLGVMALVAAAIGVMASVKRANAESDADVQAATKTMRNAIMGVVIAGMSLLIVQLVAGLFGLSVFDLANFNNLLPGR